MNKTNADLLNRYLQAVKFWLPRAQQHDILAELDEDLTSQIEERESAQGEPLTEDELVAILRRRGSPMRVAAAYLGEQRLINPALLPVYRLVLKIILLWVLAPLFAMIYIGPILASGHPGRVLLDFFSQAWRTGFLVVGIVTTVFALFEHFHIRFKAGNWDPRKLPRLASAQQTASRWNHLAGFVGGLIAAACVAYFWQRKSFSFPGGAQIILIPAWSQIGWPALFIALASALTDGFSFLFPAWTRARSAARLFIDACTCAMVAILFSAFPWVTIAIPRLFAGDLAKAMAWINGSIRISLLVIALIALGDAVREIRNLLQLRRPPASAPMLTS